MMVLRILGHFVHERHYLTDKLGSIIDPFPCQGFAGVVNGIAYSSTVPRDDIQIRIAIDPEGEADVCQN